MVDNNESHDRQDIDYRPKDDDYHVSLGGNYPGTDIPVGTDYDNTYANESLLRDRLSLLKNNIFDIRSQLETVLGTYSLPITQSIADKALRDAHAAVWPTTLADQTPSFITYPYYKVLGNVTSAGAKYLRQRYEMAMRDTNGNSALDLLSLIDMIQNEADLIGSFLDQYVGNVDDSSEFRTLELFQDWVENAFGEVRNVLQTHDDQNSLPTLPASDVQTLDPSEASRAQALFQIKLNSLNEEIVSHLTLLRRNFADYAEAFFNSFLGPALQTRLSVTRNFYPKSGLIGAEMNSLSAITENTFISHLTDQLRRIKFFDAKLTEITNLISMRDSYRNYIFQLATKGTAPPSSGSGVIVVNGNTISPSTVQQLSQAVRTSAAANNFQADHAQLANAQDPNAHPQYVLTSGGVISGDLAVADGVTVGGINPASHAHTGEDGSVQISGADIIPGTIPPGSIDSTNIPDAPTNIKLVRQINRNVGTGTNVVDVQISFEGEESNSYEISIAAVSNG